MNPNDNEVMDQEYGSDIRSTGGLKILLVLLCTAFIPSFILAAIIYYLLFQVKRYRPRISFGILAILFALIIILTPIIQPLSFFKDIDFKNNSGQLIKLYAYICVLLSFIASSILIWSQSFQLKRHPELRAMKGWARDFKYAETPLIKIRRKQNSKSLNKGLEYDSERAPVGILDEPAPHGEPEEFDVEDKNAASIVYRYYTEAKAHSLITGKTGSGKTVTMLGLIKNDVLSGYPLCIIDFKKSPDLIYFLSKWAQENNREFYHFVSGRVGTYRNPFAAEQATYDPLSSGTATSKADMILNLRTWDTSSEVFKKRTQDLLQSIFYLLERTPHDRVPSVEWNNGGLAQFVSALNIDNLKLMIEVMNEDYEEGLLEPGDVRRLNSLMELYNELAYKKSSGLKDQIDELVSICRTLIVSSYGDWLARGASSKHIDLYKIATSQEENPPIVLFSFNPQEEADFAKYIGSIVMSDLSRVSALKNARGVDNLFGLYIDEFQTLDPDSVKDNLEKARSANFYITLSLQSLEQIIKAASKDGQATLNAILDTVSNFFFHDGSGYDTAETMAKIIGKKRIFRYQTNSKISSGMFSFNWLNTRKANVVKVPDEDWIVPPEKFQSLSSPVAANKYKSTAYFIAKSVSDTRFERVGGALARKVHIVVEEELSKGAPKSFKEQIDTSVTSDNPVQKIKQKPISKFDDGDWEIEEVQDDLSLQDEGIVVDQPKLPKPDEFDLDLGEIKAASPVQTPKAVPLPTKLPGLGKPPVKKPEPIKQASKPGTSFDSFKAKKAQPQSKPQTPPQKQDVEVKKPASSDFKLPEL